MKFHDIGEDSNIEPGEYLLHVPSKTIVICGKYNGTSVRALNGPRLFEDDVDNFKKITLSHRERKSTYVASCKGCGG